MIRKVVAQQVRRLSVYFLQMVGSGSSAINEPVFRPSAASRIHWITRPEGGDRIRARD